jgi:hypothetical protein
LIDESVPDGSFAPRLDSDSPGRQHPFACIEEARLDDRVCVDHHHCIPFEFDGAIDSGLPGRRTTRFIAGFSPQHLGTE